MTANQTVGANWRTFFWVATAFNLLIGLGGMLAPGATIDARIAGLLIFGFGVVYFFVARDPLRFAPVLWAGVLGKVGVVALLAPSEFSAEGSRLVAGILVGDILFAIGFLAFLFRYSDTETD